MRNLHSIADTPTPRGDWFSFYPFTGAAIDPGLVQDSQRRFLNDYMDTYWLRPDRVSETEDLLIRLERARHYLFASGSRLPAEVVLRVTRHEMYLLRGYARSHQYPGMFGPEGALPSFRGIPLCVDGP